MGSFSKTIPQTEIFNMEAINVLIQLLLFGAISPSPMTNGTEPIKAKTIDSLFGIDEDLLAEALILSSSGEAAEWNADKLGLYLRKGTANGAPLYEQMDSAETRYYLFKHDSNWIVGSIHQ